MTEKRRVLLLKGTNGLHSDLLFSPEPGTRAFDRAMAILELHGLSYSLDFVAVRSEDSLAYLPSCFPADAAIDLYIVDASSYYSPRRPQYG